MFAHENEELFGASIRDADPSVRMVHARNPMIVKRLEYERLVGDPNEQVAIATAIWHHPMSKLIRWVRSVPKGPVQDAFAAAGTTKTALLVWSPLGRFIARWKWKREGQRSKVAVAEALAAQR